MKKEHSCTAEAMQQLPSAHRLFELKIPWKKESPYQWAFLLSFGQYILAVFSF